MTAALVYPIEGAGKLANGKHLLMPGAIPIEFEGGSPKSKHPAVAVEGNEVRIRCAPVRLEIVDERGRPVAGNIKVFNDKGSLLRKDAHFRVLTVWLPVGGEYHTSLGSFTLTAAGKVEARPERLAAGVRVTAEGLRKVEPACRQVGQPRPRRLCGLPIPQAKGENPGVNMYVPLLMEPGQPVLAAVSRRQFREAVGKEFRPAGVSCRLGGAVLERHLVVKETAAIPEDRLSAAVRILKTTADDLAWVAVALPPGTFGPTPLVFAADGTGLAQATRPGCRTSAAPNRPAPLAHCVRPDRGGHRPLHCAHPQGQPGNEGPYPPARQPNCQGQAD